MHTDFFIIFGKINLAGSLSFSHTSNCTAYTYNVSVDLFFIYKILVLQKMTNER